MIELETTKLGALPHTVVFLTLSGPRGEFRPPKVFLHNSKTPRDIQK